MDGQTQIKANIMLKQNGMSLIESLIALAILSFGLIATTKMQANMTLATQASRQRVEAVALAKSKMELFRSTTPKACDASESGTYTPVQGNTTYTLVVTCIDAKTPKLVVSWSDSRGGQAVSGSANVANTVELNTFLD